MKRYPPKPGTKPSHPRVSGFVPVVQRRRADGWTSARQARFLAALALTRSVAAAARRAGMARETVYRLRRKAGAESFAVAWDRALGREPGRRKVTAGERRLRALEGLLKPRLYRGEHVGNERKVDNSALLGYLAQLDRASRGERADDGKSQSFAARSAFHQPSLPPDFEASIFAAVYTHPTPEFRGSS